MYRQVRTPTIVRLGLVDFLSLTPLISTDPGDKNMTRFDAWFDKCAQSYLGDKADLGRLRVTMRLSWCEALRLSLNVSPQDILEELEALMNPEPSSD